MPDPDPDLDLLGKNQSNAASLDQSMMTLKK
jgi:hypothetical protein